MKKGKIVLVEDDDILSKVLSEELKEAGYDIVQAFDGEEGLKVIQKVHPDLVLLDLLMPKMHGFDVLKELKKSPTTSIIPVIILTMLGRDEDIKKGLQLGAEDYIVKAQHAVAEIIEKIENYFAVEKHPGIEEVKEKTVAYVEKEKVATTKPNVVDLLEKRKKVKEEISKAIEENKEEGDEEPVNLKVKEIKDK